jgi:hypothetical protein
VSNTGSLQVGGKAIRFAPRQDKKPAASFWKIWTEGGEIYALGRNSVGAAKISVHASGQIHQRLAPKLKQDLTPLRRVGSGPWFHALEIRFLLSEGANAPPGEKERLENKSACLIPVPKGFVLSANLVVGARGTVLSCPLPTEFADGTVLWRRRLRDGRPAVLVGRTLELEGWNRDRVKYLRETLKPTVTLTGNKNNLVNDASKKPYVELFDIHWSPELGNVILVVPMGDEAVRFEEEVTPQISLDQECRKFRYQSPRSRIDVIAPNGSRVAVLEFDDVDKQIELVKDRPSEQEAGVVNMRLEPNNLIAGSDFMASPRKLICLPSISGASPRAWDYTVFSKFDGFTLSAEIQPNSVSLQNRNLPVAISQLDDREELIMTIPSKTLVLLATLDAPAASTKVLGRFTLRDRR